jgi:hypothetical protein
MTVALVTCSARNTRCCLVACAVKIQNAKSAKSYKGVTTVDPVRHW